MLMRMVLLLDLYFRHIVVICLVRHILKVERVICDSRINLMRL